MIAMLLLTIAGVAPEDIADDYAESEARLPALFAARGEQDQGPQIAAFLREHGSSPRQALVDALDSFDAVEHARRRGVSASRLARLRRRLLDPQWPGGR